MRPSADQVKLVAAAVGPTDGELLIETDGDNLGASHVVSGAPSLDAIKVPSLRLVRILIEAGLASVDALKIDIEGFEDRALIPFFKEAPPVAVAPRGRDRASVARRMAAGLHRRHDRSAAIARSGARAATRCSSVARRSGTEHRARSLSPAKGTMMPIEPPEIPPPTPGQPDRAAARGSAGQSEPGDSAAGARARRAAAAAGIARENAR